MNKNEFYKEFHEFLEIESVDQFDINTNLKDLEEYGSLTIMSIIAFVDEHFAVKLSSDQLNAIVTIEDLINAVGSEKFEN